MHFYFCRHRESKTTYKKKEKGFENDPVRCPECRKA
ncbi:MAG: zinc-ribbon domain containing protein, partial [Flavobacteriales bacterium]